MEDLLKMPSVKLVQGDQCQYGAETAGGDGRTEPVKKPTGFMSNAPRLLERLSRRCQGTAGSCSRRQGGRHVIYEGKVARDAARYPRGLCKAMIKGMIAEMHHLGIARPGEIGLNAVTDDAEDQRQMKGPEQGYSGTYRDDVTGQILKDELVREAREKELRYFHERGFGRNAPRKRPGVGQDAKRSRPGGLMSTRAMTSIPVTDRGSLRDS